MPHVKIGIMRIKATTRSNPREDEALKVNSTNLVLICVAALKVNITRGTVASRKYCHRMKPHPLFANISHQVVPVAWVTILATRWSYLH